LKAATITCVGTFAMENPPLPPRSRCPVTARPSHVLLKVPANAARAGMPSPDRQTPVSECHLSWASDTVRGVDWSCRHLRLRVRFGSSGRLP
jgi:hypothetical protein